jgi:hypothetical protein
MEMPTHNRRLSPDFRWRPYFLLVIAPLCWASNAVVAKGVIHLIPPVSLAFWRWCGLLRISMQSGTGHF